MFDLDKSIASWRHLLVHNPTFTTDDLDELEQHIRDQVEMLVKHGYSTSHAFECAMHEMGDYAAAETEYRKVYWGKCRRRGAFFHEITWRIVMLLNHLKMAFRTLRKHTGYTFINVAGLTIGIACCLLIGMYVRFEWSYDHFHAGAEDLYRLLYNSRIGTDLPEAAPHEYRAWGSAAIAPLLKDEFPEVRHTVRLSGRHEILISRGNQSFQEERYFFSDPTFFEVFSFPFLQGNPESALELPYSIVLTETAARRYFGDEPALGRTLKFGSEATGSDLTVTGVMEDVPPQSHLEFDLLLSMSTFENSARANDQAYKFDSWGYIDFFTYVLLEKGTSAETLEAKFPSFIQQYNGENLQNSTYSLKLESIKEAYLSPTGGFQAGPKGNEKSLYLFSFIGLFILLIACVNFMNLATAHAANRAKEVGVRKTVGALRSGLISQFLTEAILMAAVASGLALVLAGLSLPLFRRLSDRFIPDSYFTDPTVLGAVVVTLFLVGLLAGSYPAFVLSGFRPTQVLKGRFSGTARGQALRKGLVVFQFAAAITLIVGTFVVREQLHFLQNQPLGFDDAQQLVVDFGGDGIVRENIESIKQEMSALPSVQGVSVSRSIPGGYFPHANTIVEGPDGSLVEIVPGLYEVDVDFLPQIGAQAAAGRLFSRAFATDSAEGLLLNEAAVRSLGYAESADVVGKRFQQWGREGTVVGVVKNFNHESLHNEIRPLSFRISPWLNYVVLQVDARDATSVVSSVRARWSQLVPHRPFLYSFLDQSFDAQYRAEDRFGVLFGTFAALAIFIACLGLFGLAAYSARQRTKEIGVRKVLGAGVAGLVALLVKDFVKLVLIGFLIATPVAYLGMNRWLQGFAYHTELSLGIFLIAGLTALLIALLTVSYQSIKAALADPVKSLRYE